jgi:uncharacterized protein (TIGR03086 family)
VNEQHIALWRETAEAFDQRLQTVGDQWEAGTPCDGWSVKDLVAHAVGVQQMVAGGVLGAQLDEGADWGAVRDGITSALEDPSVLDGEVPQGPFGPMPKSMMLGIATSDLLIHTWDLARAIGADESLPAGPVEAAYMGLQRMPEQALRSDGRFSPAIEVADDADTQSKLLGFAGRQV